MNTTLTVKTPKKLRDEAKKTAARIGVPLTTVVNNMLRRFVQDEEITFSVHIPNAETRQALREAQNPRMRGRSYATVDEMFEEVLGKVRRKRA